MPNWELLKYFCFLLIVADLSSILAFTTSYQTVLSENKKKKKKGIWVCWSSKDRQVKIRLTLARALADQLSHR